MKIKIIKNERMVEAVPREPFKTFCNLENVLKNVK